VAENWSQKHRDDAENSLFHEAFHTSSDKDIVRAQPPVSPPEESHRFGLGVRLSPFTLQSPHSLDAETPMSRNAISSALPLYPKHLSDDRNNNVGSNSVCVPRTKSLEKSVPSSSIRPNSSYPESLIAQSQSWPIPGATLGKENPPLITGSLEKEIRIQQGNSPKTVVGPSVKAVLNWIERKKKKHKSA
jgi:hypothetical protein